MIVGRPEGETPMPKYLIQGSYTDQGLKGLLKDGGTKRRDAIEQVTAGMGGKLETFYFSFGNDDFVVIVDLPSSVDATAVALAVNASGAVRARTSVLIAPEDVDQATRKTVSYRPPGQ
jgi:uncharacterized protein with GYD domain